MTDLAQLLATSGLFDPEWYCATYPDVGLTGIDPLRHFVTYGRALGRAPGPGFDPVFYAAHAPDLAADQDPLCHYLRHGRAEGRLPTPQAAQARDGMTRLRRLQAELWGGLDRSAGAALAALLDDLDQPEQVRFEAGCQLAIWRDFSGDAAAAEALLERLGGMSARVAESSARLIPLSLLYARRGATRAAHGALNAIAVPDRGTDRVLALANLAANDDDRLALINSLYSSQNLAPLRRRDRARPLNLANLATDPCPRLRRGIGKVSVIMPAYQAAGTILPALDGLLRQSHANLEIIVVDDASSDDTFDRVAALARKDRRIVPLRLPQNAGAYGARNAGLARATGAFITTHDADDWSHPQKIERQLATLAAAPELMAVIAHWARVRDPLQITSNWRLGAKLLQWSHSSLLFRREAADRLGGWDPVKVSGDMEYIWRIEAAFGPGSVRRILPDLPLAFALDDAGSLTRNPLTHVRTTYFGLRHYYREICRYWHARAPQGLTPQQQDLKRAMLPAAIWPGQDGSMRADLLIRADCCDPAAMAKLAGLAGENPARRIALSHHPDPGFAGRKTGYSMIFDDGFFDLLQRDNVIIACPEDRVQADEVLRL
ncbi:Glycosyl transferase family 2 [Thalassovita gelatinovora]|uniref:glycosyltransferase family 2 protein n=1 Tax=Thalassovita gelatinovora TaxID=53501 RepID=UPI0008BBD5AF|nr:glycosyltransferase family A protein [Thalassovita gelatinovora]SER10881.1 Glycosyl transferase family 2 [Thalassovita gelatinovora]